MTTVKGGARTTFPVGYHALHHDVSINFQMNRFYNWVGDPVMLEEMRGVSPMIATYADLKREILRLAEISLADGANLKAAYYLRLAEFFLFVDDPDKQTVRRRALDLMKELCGLEESRHFLIPYEAAQLSAFRLTPPHPKGTLVIFGGFDSYIEEWLPMFFLLRDEGYDVVAFEGPGQGTVLEDFHLPMTHEWEKPVTAVLDYFQLEDVTLIGFSLGGCLAIRAAAHESRVSRVVADDILTDFFPVLLGQTRPLVRASMKLLLRVGARGVVNALMGRAMQKSRVVEWGARQGMHVMGVRTPYDFFRRIMLYRTGDVARMVTQDVLLMAGAEDHYVPVSQLHDQIRSLTHARSVTARLFTREESAQNHCHIGNLGLSLRVILNWVEQTSRKCN